MKRWPLARKLMLWSALVVGVSLLVCLSGAAWFIEHGEMAALDREMATESEQLFFDMAAVGKGGTTELPNITNDMVPPALAGRFIELRGRRGELLFRSANLGEHSLQDRQHRAPSGHLGERHVRTAVFQDEELTLYLAADLAENDDLVRKLRTGFFVALPLVLAVVGFGSRWIARQALRPIRAMAATAERITAERLDQRLEVPPTGDEIGRLSAVLNEMFDRLDASFQQAVRFSADASHELRTPLTIMRAGIEDLLRTPGLDPATEETLHDLLEEARRLAAISEDLLLLSRADAGHFALDLAEVDLCEIVRNCIEDVMILAEPHGIRIETDLPKEVRMKADANRLSRVFLNLFENAVRYNRDGGSVRVKLARTENRWELAVANTGTGIAPEHATRLFERFYRAAPGGSVRGHGLGLSIARELIRAHGGELALAGSDAEWTTFRVRLPAE